jgi:F0F1-type ATP synthase membrane subunit b/b'
MHDAVVPDEAEALEKIREHELMLERRLDEARRDARDHLAEVTKQAERLAREADESLRAELERMRSEHARELESISREAHEALERRRRDLERRHGERHEAAIALVLELLGGNAGSEAP